MHKILFIGLGTMGYPMAGHLSKINEVTVCNRTLSKSQQWIEDYNGKFISTYRIRYLDSQDAQSLLNRGDRDNYFLSLLIRG